MEGGGGGVGFCCNDTASTEKSTQYRCGPVSLSDLIQTDR